MTMVSLDNKLNYWLPVARLPGPVGIQKMHQMNYFYKIDDFTNTLSQIDMNDFSIAF